MYQTHPVFELILDVIELFAEAKHIELPVEEKNMRAFTLFKVAGTSRRATTGQLVQFRIDTGSR